MRKVVWLKIFRGNEILYKADGTPSNENQIVKLTHGNIEWFNYIKLLAGAGLCVVKVVKVLIKEDGELVETDIPNELIEEVRLAHEGDNTIILTDEQKKIGELEEEAKEMKKQLASLVAKMVLSTNGIEKPLVSGNELREQTLEDLKKAYKEKFGKAPHHKTGIKKLKEKLAE